LAGQENTDGDRAGDPCDDDHDNDDFADAVELHLGTDSLDNCPNNPSHDAWPPDINIDTRADVADVLLFKPLIGLHSDDSTFDVRFDLYPDDMINVADVLMHKLLIDTSYQ